MDLNWPISVGPPSFVDIPIIQLDCEADATAQWREAKKQWANNGTVGSAWGDYFALADEQRLRLHTGGQASRGFPEFHTAVTLSRQGYECWSGVQFFDYGKPLIKDGLRKANTKRVRDLWEKELAALWPSRIQNHLAGSEIRNPDIAAYNRKRNEWRFCETKSWTDEIAPGQLTGLAVLHLLTGAPVSIVRLLPRGKRMKSRKVARGVIRYADDADVSWVKR